MSRIDLQVPFNEKEEARRLGARWDPAQKVWYVPANVDPAPLQKWHPRPLTPNMRASLFFLATTTRDCWRCAAVARVVALVLPAGHEDFYVGDDPADDHWQESAEPVVLSYVRYLTEPVAARLRPLAPHYRIDFSQTTGTSYWMNHCEHCAAKLGDFDTICEYGVAFSPLTTEQAAGICLEEIAEPFSTSCGGYTYIEWFADAQHPKSSCSHSAARHGKYSSLLMRTIMGR
jgi:hypothetical protein